MQVTSTEASLQQYMDKVSAYFRAVHEPGLGKVTHAKELSLSPIASVVAFTGEIKESLDSAPRQRVCLIDLQSDRLEELSAHGTTRLPCWAPSGDGFAFIREDDETSALMLATYPSKQISELCKINGRVEYIAWSPDGTELLLGTAGAGADLSGAAGSGKISFGEDNDAELVVVDYGTTDSHWRRAVVFDVNNRQLKNYTPDGLNVWEACWCGNDKIAAVVSDDPSESEWYRARLLVIDANLDTEFVAASSVEVREMSSFEPKRWGLLSQLAWPAASPNGEVVAFVRAFCSDRTICAGDVYLKNKVGELKQIDTLKVDVSQLNWRDNQRLFMLGMRGLQIVACEFDQSTGKTQELWCSDEACGDFVPAAAVAPNAFAVALHGYKRYFEIVCVEQGTTKSFSLKHGGTDYAVRNSGEFRSISWKSKDGLMIEGFLITPSKPAEKLPLAVVVHGGPVSTFKNSWSMSYAFIPVLVQFGFAVFMPNIRGGLGRGQDFAKMVAADMGGSDAADVLSGINHVKTLLPIDEKRIGVMGRSYGGYMACWMPCTTDVFSSAVALAPVTDWISQHYTSNIGLFDEIFLGARPIDGGPYISRSPIMFAHKIKCPILLMSGSADRCTPPGQAIEMHNAVQFAGGKSCLVTYPGQGHHVHDFRMQVDQCARMVHWLSEMRKQ